MGLLVKVIALQKLACLLTVFWVRSMTIWDPLAFGWNRSGLIGRAPLMVPHWIGRHLLGLWWHRCDVDGNWPPRESDKETKHIQRWALQLNEFFIHSRSLGLFSLIQCFSFKTLCTKVLCSLLFLSNKIISCNDYNECRGKPNIYACQECNTSDTEIESCSRCAAPTSLQLMVGMSTVTHIFLCLLLFRVGFYAGKLR